MASFLQSFIRIHVLCFCLTFAVIVLSKFPSLYTSLGIKTRSLLYFTPRDMKVLAKHVHCVRFLCIGVREGR